MWQTRIVAANAAAVKAVRCRAWREYACRHAMSADSAATIEPPDAPLPGAPRLRLPRPQWVAAGVGVALAVAFLGAYLTPRAPEVTRSVDIAAPVDVVFPLVADLRLLPEWSMLFLNDPAVSATYTGPLDGVGQTLTWASSLPAVGSGVETIVAVDPDRSVELTSIAAGRRAATVLFTLEANGQATRLVRSYRTDLGLNPVERYRGLSIDGVVGPDLERSLTRLKAIAEAVPKG
jgi:uncharacterized protein YndB with AHSA1/START domain